MGTKLLLVDDIEGTLQLNKTMFSNVGFDVFVAGPDDPVADARRLWDEHPDLRLALVDLEMPAARDEVGRIGVGLALINDLKSIRPEARIAVLSGHNEHESLANVALSAADGFVFKTWPPEKQLRNVAILKAWVATAPLHTLLATARMSPQVNQRVARVSRFCRQIVTRLYSASPEVFDLASCLAAAELHVLGSTTSDDDYPSFDSDMQLSPFPVGKLEEQIQFAYELSQTYEGFEEVGRILALRRRCFAAPQFSWIIDAPDADDARENAIPIEARVLGVACAFTALMSRTTVNARCIDRALKTMKRFSELGKFAPEVVDALFKFVRDSMDEVLATLRSGQIVDQKVLSLTFESHQKVSIFELARIFEMLSKPMADSLHPVIVSGITVCEDRFKIELTDETSKIERLRIWIQNMMNDAATLQNNRDNMDPGIVRRLESLLILAPQSMDVTNPPSSDSPQ